MPVNPPWNEIVTLFERLRDMFLDRKLYGDLDYQGADAYWENGKAIWNGKQEAILLDLNGVIDEYGWSLGSRKKAIAKAKRLSPIGMLTPACNWESQDVTAPTARRGARRLQHTPAARAAGGARCAGSQRVGRFVHYNQWH